MDDAPSARMSKIIKWLATGAGIASAAYATYAARTWRRFGRPPAPRGPARDELLDRLMPQYDVCERHHIAIEAPPDVTFAAAKQMRLDSSRMIRGLFKARELILRGREDTTPRPKGLLDELTSIGWGIVGATSGHELVLGAATKPWEANPVFRTIPAAEFAKFAEPDYVKIAVTLRVDPRADGGSTFFTETRAVATDAAARKKFRVYWALLSPGIILIREAMVRGLADAADRAWWLAGDDLLADARAQLTHAVTIDAPPRNVWPWLVQMGCQRAGWYSWDVLDNAGKRSADRIIPELQHVAPGDIFPWSPGKPEGFDVARVEPEHALVLHSAGPKWEGTWAFVLLPLPGDRTRLVTRYRAAYPASLDMAVRLPVMRAMHAIMETKQLRTIKHHAEHVITGAATA